MPKSYMQLVHEWSLRNMDPNMVVDPASYDPEKLEWLRNAWDNLYIDGATLMKNCLGALSDPLTTVEEQTLICEELSDLLENIDNATVFGLINGWAKLNNIFNSNKQTELNQNILRCVQNGVHSCDKVQKDVLPVWSGTLKQILSTLNQDYQRQLLGILSSFYQNKEMALVIHEQLENDFVKIYRQKGFADSERFKHLMNVFKSAAEEEVEYNEFVKILAAE
ncbi:Conserved_hypothetical protein [Hexamita inflata]|uniref:Nucleotide exchange factor Fes1 domain-containing protein n=1 Tax=Hexamita inflata TaxID=28002 RepID=A0AA86NMX3_9EUKA|nr:Conserved hypothetical protein [Hexamita inflata]